MKIVSKSFYFYGALAFLSAWAAMRACGLGTFHPFSLVLFLLLCFSYRCFFSWDRLTSAARSEKIVSIFTAALFTVFYLCADYEQLLSGLENRLFRLVHLLIAASGLFILFAVLILAFFLRGRDFIVERRETPASPSRLPLYSFFICLLCWLPYLAMNFPGVMTVDSLNQYGQIIGALPYSNHHPWVHTMLIKFWYSLGLMLTGKPLAGLALYTVFQMCVMAFIAAYLVSTLLKYRVNNKLCIAVLLFYALVPYNALYAVTMWKDILFSGFVLLFSTVLLRFVHYSQTGESLRLYPGDCILYVLSAALMCLLRSNGWYAFLLTLPFLLFFFRRRIRTHILMNLLVLSAVIVVKGPVMNAFHVAQPDFIESLSIPIQQAARVYFENQPVSPEDDALWNRIMDTSRIEDVYYSRCSDNIKNLIRSGNPGYLNEHKGEFLKLWFRFGLEHPGPYFRAYVDATVGYWYPDVENLIGSNERIAENDYGLTAAPLFGGSLAVKGREILFKLHDMVPLYGLLWCLGAYFWAAILLCGKTFVHHSRARLVIFIPNLAIMATLFAATPVYNEFRYAYPLILTMPLFLVTAFSHMDKLPSCGGRASSETAPEASAQSREADK